LAERAVYRVDGLDCAEEVNVLRRALRDRPGVLSLDFDLLNARMTVTYDPEVTDVHRMAAHVAQAGMHAVPWEERGTSRGSFWEERGRLVMASASGLFLLAGFVAHWALHGSLMGALVLGHHAAGHALPALTVVLYWAAAISGAYYVIPKAALAARRLRPDMNLLMTVAVIGAMAIGEWFEAATVAFLFAVALLLEHWSVGRARNAISALLDLSPDVARCVSTDDDSLMEVPVEHVALGTMVVVRPGEKIPLDGQVMQGSSEVDEAPITGESRPVSKGRGQQVYAGTINQTGTLQFEVNRAAGDTTLARIIHLVEESQSRRAPSELWVEAFSRHYTPAMMGLALLVLVVPPLFFGGAWAVWLYRTLVLLVIACPCALVISTPVSLVSALTCAARNGVLVKGGAYLEAVGRVRALALDKTGTLTHGRPEVRQVVALNGHTAAGVLETAAALEADSVHPLAEAVVREAVAQGVPVKRPEEFRSLHGRGAEARIDGRLFWIGSHRMMEERGAETPEAHRLAEELEAQGDTVMALGTDDHVCGLISAADGIRDHATAAVGALKALGVRKIVMLTGDNETTASAVAQATGVDEFRATLLPEEKVEEVGSLVRQFERVAMVGDGVNDAPAMAAANIGIAMGAIGTDAAIETSDITLMSDDLLKLPWLLRHSRRTRSIVQQNVFSALGVKVLFLALAVSGAATLWMAVAADMGASLLVTFNGLRLLRDARQNDAAS